MNWIYGKDKVGENYERFVCCEDDFVRHKKREEEKEPMVCIMGHP
jgi:hypothetical protein